MLILSDVSSIRLGIYMNYKKIFRSRNLRQRIMKWLSFVPDSKMLPLQYRIKLKRWPDLKNPARFSEKIQLYKMFYRNPVLGECVDKLHVRDFVGRKGLASTLPKLYGTYEKAEDIDFSSLPSRFVIKTNDGGGGDNIVICRDKSELDIPSTVKTVNSWLDKKKNNAGREWAYTRIPKSLIIVEEFLENVDNPEGGLEDFKFFCFNGKPFCLAHDAERYIGHKRNFYDLDWNNLHIGSDCENYEGDAPRPVNLDEMIKVAGILSEDFPFVRVDLYSVGGKVYFGELTFYPWSGYVQYDPDDFDLLLGRQFDLSTILPRN